MEDGQHTHGGAQGDGSDDGVEIGRILEQQRKERGLSLEEVEQATKIRKRYLTGLEREDYTILPDAVYARGFLKTYANYLGLDGEALSQQLKSNRKPRRERGINYDAWNRRYTAEGDAAIIDDESFEGIRIEPAKFNAQASTYAIAFRFSNLDGTASSDDIRITALARDVNGHVVEVSLP